MLGRGRGEYVDSGPVCLPACGGWVRPGWNPGRYFDGMPWTAGVLLGLG